VDGAVAVVVLAVTDLGEAGAAAVVDDAVAVVVQVVALLRGGHAHVGAAQRDGDVGGGGVGRLDGVTGVAVDGERATCGVVGPAVGGAGLDARGVTVDGVVDPDLVGVDLWV